MIAVMDTYFIHRCPGDITANFTNLGLTAEYGTNVTVIINPRVNPMKLPLSQIGGAAQTINWQGGLALQETQTELIRPFTILNDGGSYVVLGQMVDLHNGFYWCNR